MAPWEYMDTLTAPEGWILFLEVVFMHGGYYPYAPCMEYLPTFASKFAQM